MAAFGGDAMGCDGHVEVKRIGDGQHLLEDWVPRFVIHVGRPVVVLNVYRNNRLHRHSSLRPWTTHNEDVDAEAVNIEGVEGPTDEHGGYKALVVPLRSKRGQWEKAVVVASRRWLEKVFDMSDLGLPADRHGEAEAYAKLVPGLWVVTRYSESGMEDPVHYHCDLPTGCEIRDTVSWQLWT